MITLTPAQAAEKAYNSTATVKGTNGVSYMISCWHDEPAEKILARATMFYGHEMVEVISTDQIWMLA